MRLVKCFNKRDLKEDVNLLKELLKEIPAENQVVSTKEVEDRRKS